jgi:hypothetical protein
MRHELSAATHWLAGPAALGARRMRRARALIGALTLAGVIFGALALIGVVDEGAAKPKPPTSFAFDSHYEVSQAEGEVTEKILEKEMKAEEQSGEEPELESEPGSAKHQEGANKQLGEERFETGGGLSRSVGIKSAKCLVSPPPPSATRLVCSVVVSVHELHGTYKAVHANYWKATVNLDPTNGAMSVDLKKLNNTA